MAQPLPLPRLYTVAEYLALGETEPGYSELVEGRMIVNPGPSPDHNLAGLGLALALRQQVPADLVVIPDLDVDLELARPDKPGFVRRPDVVVAQRTGLKRVRAEGGAIRASEVVLVIEVVSPSSVRTDNVIKRAEYADAGIPHYWIVDLSEPASVLVCHLAGEFGYVDGGWVTGVFGVSDPFRAEIDLNSLQ
ncbi:MAG: Uma2 family endonuclease [Pseudonocardia sp.]|nr:Uma2 family endonuclease [Pseudonocardia sp.]